MYLYYIQIVAHKHFFVNNKMNEEKIQQLLVGELKPVSARIPAPLYERLLEKHKKRIGPQRERGMITDALCYFSARGLLDWERENKEENQEQDDTFRKWPPPTPTLGPSSKLHGLRDRRAKVRHRP